ncbi:MAG TPA: citrate synthase [Kribbellaceae bacterium]|nr:citrate synthase [Kribbellaceae bacterium]
MKKDRSGGLPRLTTAQAAARLGVKQETVYAYVSRGILTRERAAGARASTFDALEVEALARRTAGRSGTAPPRPGQAAGSAAGRPLMVLDSGLTLIVDDELFYRGADATSLATRASYETCAHWLWTGAWDPSAGFSAPPDALRTLRETDGWRATLSTVDRLRLGASVAGSANPLRYQLDQDAVVRSAAGLVPVLVAALHEREPAEGYEAPGSVASRLWRALAPDAGDDDVRVLEAALVLLLDHDLAMSTLAARVAASARAHPYAVVAAGLAALDGTLHGAASVAAHRMLQAAMAPDRGAADVVGEILRAGNALPGFGHVVYTHRDPRADALFELLRTHDRYGPALEATSGIIDVVAGRTGLFPTIDLALAVLSVGRGLRPDAGEAVFAVARTCGWIAHALEEYGEQPARLRPVARYTGPQPGGGPSVALEPDRR